MFAAASAIILNYPNKHVFNKLTVDLFLCWKFLHDKASLLLLLFFHGHGGESEIVGNIQQTVTNSLYFYIYFNK